MLFATVLLLEDDSLKYPSTYENIVEKYNACTDNYLVITGAFGIEFINRMRASIGASNVIAINITRNPSVSFALHQRIANFNDEQTDMSASDHALKYHVALYNSAILKQDSSITTVKFSFPPDASKIPTRLITVRLFESTNICVLFEVAIFYPVNLFIYSSDYLFKEDRCLSKSSAWP